MTVSRLAGFMLMLDSHAKDIFLTKNPYYYYSPIYHVIIFIGFVIAESPSSPLPTWRLIVVETDHSWLTQRMGTEWAGSRPVISPTPGGHCSTDIMLLELSGYFKSSLCWLIWLSYNWMIALPKLFKCNNSWYFHILVSYTKLATIIRC